VLGAIVTWCLVRPLAVSITDWFRPPTPAAPALGVSVVIPCHNAAAVVEHTVDTLLRQTFRPIEIVLVENASTDRTWDLVRALAARHPEVKALRVSPTPGSYAASVAINHGVVNASYPLILRLDDDTTIRHDAVECAVAEIEARGAAAAACNLRLSNPQASMWTRLQALEYLLAMDLDRRAQNLVRSILCCSGGMAMFRRDVILRAGGFVSAPREVSEDMDMTLKSHRLGRVTIAPEAIGFTEAPESLEALIRQRFRWSISGTVALYIHRRGIANPSYWHDGLVGFLGLPFRALVALRDLLAPVYLLDLSLLLAHDGPVWIALLLGGRMALMSLEMVLLRPALHREASLQGLYSFWLIPLFVLLYGPLLLATRFAGTWTALWHVRELRLKQEALQSEGIDYSVGESHSGRLVVVPDAALT
jgi:biofilm PGA synthesis N-glycosyltransferase PgaC